MSMQNRFAVAALVLISVAPVARAQEVVPVSMQERAALPTAAPGAGVEAPTGPRIESARSGVALAPTPAERLVPNAPMMRQSRRGQTLMIVGGAALIGGAIIGGDAGTLIMVGGLGVGLYGLYLYVQ